MKKDNRIKNLDLVAQLLRQDETMQKLGLETESQLQKTIDAIVEKIDQGQNFELHLSHKVEK